MVLMDKAFTVLEVMGFTSEERDAYEGKLKWYRTKASALLRAEEKGIEKGIKTVAKNLLAAGVDIEMVAKSTGLSIQAIKALQ